jgi:hypothetical protein
VYPNPELSDRYVMLNSGFTFRECDCPNNARQVAKLPDWGLVGMSGPASARTTGEISAAGFCAEGWGLPLAGQ